MCSIYHSHIIPSLFRPYLPNITPRIHDLKQTRQKLQSVFGNPPPAAARDVVMCEKIIKYDCGHLSRRSIPCAKKKKNRQSTSSLNCFSSSSSSEECAKGEKVLERRATLCRACRAANRELEVYQNCERQGRVAQDQRNNAVSSSRQQSSSERRMSASSPRHSRQVSQAPSQRGGSRHRNERRDLPRTRNGFESPTRRTHAPRPTNIMISHPTYAEQGLPTPGTPLNRTSHPSSASRQHARNLSSLSGLTRTDSTIERLRQDIKSGLHIHAKPSDESLVCQTARKIEGK